MQAASSRGMALIVTLLAMALFSTLAGGLVLSSVLERSVAANQEEATELANAADSALELAALELGAIADWNEVLAGARTSARVDGAPGVRVLPGGAIDLVLLTNELTCGRVTLCTDAQVRTATLDRPWGANNPRWRLFL
jgi:type II secretory pathway pseudopilin PulG